MTLQESIKQNKFKDEHHKLMLNLIYSGGLIQAEQTRFFKPYDISPQQYNVLRILRGQQTKPVSIGLLQERMLDQMSNASRLVEKLKQKSLVTRNECKQDRRQMDVCITKVGLDLLEQIDNKIEAFEKRVTNLSKSEAKILNELLDKLNT
jgi:DNA-binding MarR family transcriptional regulator